MSERLTMQRIPVAGPWITQREIDYVTDAVTNAWYANANKYHDCFERAFANYLGVRYAVSLPSCTSGIHLALLAYGVRPGDEVIVPDATWIASAAPITYVGAVPVFADIDPATWCLTPESFEKNISPRTRAVIPVDLYGSMPDMDVIMDIATGCGIHVIEDAAEAIGSEYHGRKAGSLGEVGVFSFHGSKTLTTGEGGMLVTDSEAVLKRVVKLRDHGREPGDIMFFNTEVGYKYKMSSMQAALGLAQLERIAELVARKRQIFAWYHERLASVPGFTLNAEPPGTLNSYWMVTLVLDPCLGIDKRQLMKTLTARGIDIRPFFHPLSSLPAFKDQAQALRAAGRNSVAYRIGAHAINLPTALQLTERQVDQVCEGVRLALAL